MVLDDRGQAHGIPEGGDGVGGRGSGLGSHDSGCLGGHGTSTSSHGSRVDRRGNGDGFRGSGLGSHDSGCLGGHGTSTSSHGSRVDRRGNGDGFRGSCFSGCFREGFDSGDVDKNGISGDLDMNHRSAVMEHKNRDGRNGNIRIGAGGAASVKKTTDNTVMSLHYRDIGFNRPCGCRPTWKVLPSRIAKKNKDMDMYRYKEELKFYQETLRKRSAIIDITAIKDIVILRSNTCLAAAFCRVTNKLLGFLNGSRSESIEYLFYNKYKECLMIIVSSGDTDGSRCCELTIQCILRKKLNHRQQIFQDEDISWPGYLYVDSINEVILIKNKRAYRIFDLKNYLFKYEFSTTNVETVLCRPQIFLVRYWASDGELPLELKSAETGETLISMKYNITEGEKIECADLVREKLLIKQSNKNLQVVDLIRLMKQKEVEIGNFQLEPLSGRNMFLSFQHDSTEVRDSNGKIVRILDRHALYKINSIEGNVCVTREEDMLISTCRAEGRTTESVNISCIGTGRLLLTIDPNAKVTGLCFNDDLSEIYVGTENGRALVWSI